MNNSNNPVRIGVLGLGRAFTLMVPTFKGDSRVQIVAGFDPKPNAVELLTQDFGATSHDSAESLCSDPNVEWVYVATPHQYHVEHVALAARNGKNVLVEKPMALSLQDCQLMIDCCNMAGVCLIVGHSHSFNGPVLMASDMIRRGDLGRVRMIHAMNFTDFLYRPRRPEELDTMKGGGVVHSQAAHQVDIIRLLGGGEVNSVFGRTGKWDATRPTEGAYAALIGFASGAFASITYNGFGYFDSDSQMSWVGEMGRPKNESQHALTRRKAKETSNELAEAQRKAERNYGGSSYVCDGDEPPQAYQHFGPTIVCCDGGDIQLTPYGVRVITTEGASCHMLPRPKIPRVEVIDELWAAARHGREPIHSGKWAMATVEVCLAILQSESLRRAIIPTHQVRLAN